MRTLFLLLFVAMSYLPMANAQLANGSIAPDVTFTDINGNTHNLYSILDQGKSVVFDAFATWCGICWNYDNTGIIKNLYNTYGPPGTDEIAVFAIEASPSTNAACINGPAGCSGSTIGDWATGTPYPIVHIESGNQANFSSLYQIPGYPTLYKICPNKKIYHIGQASTQTWINWITSCSLEGEAQSNSATCFNDGTSGVNLTTSGGFGALSYNWSNGATTQDLMNVAPGTYAVTVSDSQGHEVELGPYLVDGPTTPINTSLSSQGDVACFGDGSGFVEINVFGGSGNYNYSWSNGDNTQDIYNLAGGSYVLTLTDGFGCTDVFSAVVSEPSPLSVTGNGLSEACGQGNGVITLFAAGGSGAYLYDIGTGNSSTSVFTGLSAGTYVATLTDNNNCQSMTTVVVDEEPGPLASAGADVLIDCATPIVTLDGTSSSSGAGLSVAWTTANGNILSGANTLTPTVDQPGTYVVDIIDQSNGCSSQDEVLVLGDIDAPDAEAGTSGTLTCAATSYTLLGSSTTSNVAFEWFDDNGLSIATTATVEVSAPGEYELVVTNVSNGCSGSDFVEVTADVAMPTASATTENEINCEFNSTELVGTASGSGTLDIAWMNENNEVLGNTNTIVVNEAGTYTFSVTNTQNGCVDEATTVVVENMNSPTADAGENQALTCEVIQVELGGNSSAGSNFNYTWTNDNNDVVGTTATINVSDAGNYLLTVKDLDNNCESTSSVQVEIDQTPPVADAGEDMHLNVTTTEVTLGGNSSSGGDIHYSWYDETGVELGHDATLTVELPGHYTLEVLNIFNGCYSVDEVIVTINTNPPTAYVVVSASLNCNVPTVVLDGSGSSTGNNVSYTWMNENGTVIGNEITVEVGTAGTYTLVVWDADCGCSSSDEVTVLASTDLPTAVATVDGDITCDVETVTLSADGSSSGMDIDYSWYDASDAEIATGLTTEVNEVGTYTLIVSNGANGCSSSITVVVTENSEEPVADIATPNSIDCNNSFVILDATSSVGANLQYNWWNVFGEQLGTNATLQVNETGLYYLEVINGSSGCNDIASVAVGETFAPSVNIESIGFISCHDGSDGSITATHTGGEGPFEYLWSDGQETITAINLSAGAYELTVTGANGCESVVAGSISNPPLLEVTVDITGETSEGANDGTATASASGGIGNYTYAWSNMQTGASVDGLAPGSYQVTVSDENHCETIEIINITAFNCILQVATSQTNIQCNGMNNGQAMINVLQGDAANISWSNGMSGNMIDNLSAGTYSYTVADDSNCEVEGSVTITEPALLENSINGIMHISCGSGLGGSATANPIGGVMPYSFVWSNGEQTQTATQLVAGMNSLVITDANGCMIDGEVMINADDDEDPVAIAQNVTISLDGSGNAFVSPAVVNNGSSDNCGIANFELSNSNFDCATLGTNTVELIVTDLSGNTNSTTAEVTVVDPVMPEITCSGSYTITECNKVSFADPQVMDNCDDWTLTLLSGMPSGSFYPEGTTTVNYRVTDAAGNMAECSFDVSVVLDLAVALETNDALCAGDASGTAMVMASGGAAGYQYTWSNGQQTASANSLAAGMHSVEVTDDAGCTETINFEIDEPSALTFTLDGLQDDATGMGDGSIDITIAGGTPPYNYVWTLDGIFHSTDEDISNLLEGNYAVEVIDANGCELAEYGLNVDNLVSASESPYAQSISILPNPTADVAHVTFDLSEGKDVQLALYSMTGQLLLQQELGMVSNAGVNLDLEKFPSGVYSLQCRLGDQMVVKKVVLQR